MRLNERINRTKEKMIDAGLKFGYTAPETLTLSQELDQLINKYMGVSK